MNRSRDIRSRMDYLALFSAFRALAVTAPLNGAGRRPGTGQVQGNRKSVQHLEGGIVREMKVKEGDHVSKAMC